MKRLLILAAFAAYACFMALGRVLSAYETPALKKLIGSMFLRLDTSNGGRLADMDFLSYILLFGLCLCGSVFISSGTYNMARGYMQLPLLRVGGKAAYIKRSARQSALNAAFLIAAICAGVAAAVLIRGIPCDADADFLLTCAVTALNYLLFFSGLNLLGFIIKLKHGTTHVIAVTAAIIIIILPADYKTAAVSLLTAGTLKQALLGIPVGVIWAAACFILAYTKVKKLDLA